jgi:glycosyltransferase involved in cell wall biosynthesis
VTCNLGAVDLDMADSEKKKRVGIVVRELGIPSEIWILRQCLEFNDIEPVIVYWKMHDRPVAIPSEIETRAFRFKSPDSKSLFRRIARRLGLSLGLMPSKAASDDIRETLRGLKLDAVLCHFAWTGLPVSAAVGQAIPIIWQVHGRDVSTHLRTRAYRNALFRALPKLDHLVAVGKFQIQALKALGLGERHSVIPCGAPVSLFATQPMPLRQAGQPFRFISVGRLSAEKGVFETLKAFEIVAAEVDDIELVMVGDGPLGDEVRSYAKSSPIGGKIHLRGVLESPEVARELTMAHAFVQHSQTVNGWIEGFGVTLTEAGAAGLPLITSNLGGIVDQVEHGRNGLLFAPGDIRAQAAHMLHLVRNETTRRKLGVSARKIARGFDSGEMTRQLEQVILGVIEQRASP